MRAPARILLSSASLALAVQLPATTYQLTPERQRWPDGTIVMQMQLGSSGGTLIDGSTSWGQPAESALAEWNSVLNGVQLDVVRNSTAAVGSGNGLNNVFWTSSVYGRSFGNAVAVTLWWRQASTTTEADVLFNTTYSWNSYRGYPLRTALGGGVLYDLRRVALHEFGHVLGLLHPDDYGQIVDAVMNSSSHRWEHLYPDDIAGVRALYGALPAPIISLSGTLAFGDVQVGALATRTLTISNAGTATLAVNSVTYPAGFSGDWPGGTIPPGASRAVTVTFAPTQAIPYAGTITVDGTQTSGTNTTMAAGTGAVLVTPSTWQLRPADFDGDRKTDSTVWRASTGVWYALRSSGGSSISQQWGAQQDIPVPGDYDGDGRSDVAVWRPSTGVWYVIGSFSGTTVVQQWGAGSAPYYDVPVPGDYDGDGRTDFSVWRRSTGVWYVIRSSNGTPLIQQWGAGSAPYYDVPVTGDFDADGRTDFAVWRRSTGSWYVIRSSNAATLSQQWGAGSGPYYDLPVPADYDGDRQTDFAVWRPSSGTWYVIPSSTGRATTQQWGAGYAPYSDVPVPGDYDGDGRTDVAVWRASSGTWFVVSSATGNVTTQQWGAAYAPYFDVPVPSAGAR